MKGLWLWLELVESPGAIVLLKGTALLALAWMAHGWPWKGVARWRVVLWRSVLCIGLALPLASLARVSLWKLPVGQRVPRKESVIPTIDRSGEPDVVGATRTEMQEISGVATGAVRGGSPPSKAWAARSANGWGVGLMIWGLGALAGATRLWVIGLGLSRLRRSARPDAALSALAAEVLNDLSVRRQVRIRVSPEVRSPFLSGLRRPMILLPSALVEEGSPTKLRAILRHEIAHLKHHDLPWSIAWRWAAVVFWFHPLVWNVPAAHNLACEEEADQMAAGEAEERSAYAQVLAEVALSAVASGTIPPVERQLSLNGAAQIVQRLKHLRAAGSVRVWRRRDSVAAGVLAAGLALLSGGWDFAQAKDVAAGPSRAREWKEALVIIQDEEGRPIPGATVEPYGFRVKGADAASAFNWLTFGPRLRHAADTGGKVALRYPVVAFPEEKQLTGKVNLIAAHPDYVTTTAEISVNDARSVVRLARGGFVEVSGYYRNPGQPVGEIVARMSGDPTPRWEETRPGIWRSTPLPAGELIFQLMGKLATGDIVHSEAQPIRLRRGETVQMAVELKPGIRLEGRIDPKVPRPVRHGRVIVAVRPKEYPALPAVEDFYQPQERYGLFHYWSSYRPIAEDGTFVFESVPPGEADVIVLGEGFISQNGPVMKNRVNGQLVDGPPFGFPQVFPLSPGLTKIEVATEAAATLRVKAKTAEGEPVAGATLYANPNVMRIGTGIFGALPKPGEEPLAEVEALPEIDYSAVTDENGEAVLNNIPAFTTMVDVTHPQFEIPLQPGSGRYVRFKLKPGEKRALDLVLQKKGKEFIGNVRSDAH